MTLFPMMSYIVKYKGLTFCQMNDVGFCQRIDIVHLQTINTSFGHDNFQLSQFENVKNGFM